MIETQYQDILEILNFELSRKDVVVLGALLKSQGSPTTYVDFGAIRAQLEIDEGGKIGKDSLIYRSISWLEKAEFIRVDRSQHKHGYNSDVGLIHKALQKSIEEAKDKIEDELATLDTDIERLSRMDVEELGSDLILLTAGKKKIERPVFAVGWENVLQLVDDKVYNQVKKGNLIRFSVEWLSKVDVITPIRIDQIGRLLENGVIFRGLEHNRISKQHLKAFKKFTLVFRKQGYQPGFRICERKDATYQFVGRNDEGIVLITSENPMSATWIPRVANPSLVDNAIQTFDEDYEAGIDIEEIGTE